MLEPKEIYESDAEKKFDSKSKNTNNITVKNSKNLIENELTDDEIKIIQKKLFGFQNNNDLIIPFYITKINNVFEKYLSLRIMEIFDNTIVLEIPGNVNVENPSARLIDWLNLNPGLYQKIVKKEVLCCEHILNRNKNLFKSFKEICDSQAQLQAIRNSLLEMYNIKVGSYSLTPFILRVLSVASIAIPFSDFLDENLPYKNIYLNLIFSATTCLVSISEDRIKEIEDRVSYMRAHYDNFKDIIRLCFNYGLILKKVKFENKEGLILKKENFEITESLWIVRDIIIRSWDQAFKTLKIHNSFSQLDDVKVMDLTLNMFKALVLSLIIIKNKEIEFNNNKLSIPIFNANPKLIEEIIDIFSSSISNSLSKSNVFINVVNLHFPNYIRFTNIHSISDFQSIVLDVAKKYLPLKSDKKSSVKSTLNKSSTDEKSEIIKLSIKENLNLTYNKLFKNGGLVKNEIFYNINFSETPGDINDLNEIMFLAKDHIFDKTGIKAKTKLPYIIVLLSGFIGGLPIFQVFENNSSVPKWLKYIMSAAAFGITALLAKLYTMVNNSYYKYNREFERFNNNIRELFEKSYFKVEEESAITAEDNYHKYMYILASSIKKVCVDNGIVFNSFNNADKAFLVMKLFNALAPLMHIDNEESKKIELSKEIRGNFINLFANEIKKCLTDSFKTNISKGHLTSVAIKGLNKDALSQCVIKVLGDQLTDVQKQNISSNDFIDNKKVTVTQENYTPLIKTTANTMEMLRQSEQNPSMFSVMSVLNAAKISHPNTGLLQRTSSTFSKSYEESSDGEKSYEIDIINLDESQTQSYENTSLSSSRGNSPGYGAI